MRRDLRMIDVGYRVLSVIGIHSFYGLVSHIFNE